MGKIIGIDLGTTFSCVAVMEGGKPVVISNAEGARTTPSIVAMKSGERLVGQVARNQAVINPENTVRSIKRHMGENYKVTLEGKQYTPQEISAMILQKLKSDAEAYLGEKVTEAVITVPAYFDDAQRQATKDAGKIAGLDVKRIINEPTAASLAYGLDKSNEHTILVFDFGGGTFDVSVLELGDGVFEVKATNGDTHLGGDDIDNKIVDWLADTFRKDNGIDLRKDKMAMQRLLEAAEKAKIELSSKMTTTINLPFITADQNGPKHINVELNRAKFEAMISDILERLKVPTLNAMKDAKLSSKDINKVIFVGGSTRIPIVQTLVKDLIGKDGDKSVNPDEAVAVGAAIQGGILGGEVKDILLLDVTPLSLGIETLGGVFTKMIERNTTIPTKKSQIFSTAEDNQNAVTIRVAQGERSMFADNKLLGSFDLVGMPPAPRGVPKIEVSFDIDANGIMHVSAKDLATSKEQSIKITSTTNLDDKEVEKMRKDAEAHAAEDEKKREEVEIVNHADSLVYSTEKLLKDFEGKVSESDIKEIKDEIAELKKLLEHKEHRDVAAIKSKLDILNQKIQKASTEMYQKAGAQPGQESGENAEHEHQHNGHEHKGHGKDDAVDADFKVKDD